MDQNTQMRISNVERELRSLRQDAMRVDHRHNGYDMSRIDFKDIQRKKIYVNHTIVGTAAATATNYGVFYIVPVNCVVTAVKEVHQTAGTDGGTVSLNIEKLEEGEALGSGNNVLASDLSLKATINTVQDGSLTLTLADKTLKPNDRLAMKDTGTLTAVANVTVMVELTVLS